jgi:hypothetical protein
MPSAFTERRRVDALFKALSSDYLLREQFVTDPAQLLAEYVSGERLDPEAAAATNQLIYAIVSNPGLLSWMRSYRGERVHAEGDEFALDFAGALARHGDEQTILAVLRAANENQDLFTVQAAVLGRLIAAFGDDRGSIFAGTEQSSPGTEVSPGGGTEVSPGRVFAGTEMSSPGTEMSPGRVFAGTEMSSPGTEISPGPGTDMSPGRLGAVDFRVTLDSLVEFATELRRAGALNALRFK